MDFIALASDNLLRPAELSEQALFQVLTSAPCSQADYADLFLQSNTQESWYLENGLVKQAHQSYDQGFGLRAIIGETVGFSYANALDLKSLQHAAEVSRAIARRGDAHSANLSLHPVAQRQLYPADSPFDVVTATQKVAFMQQLDRYLRAADTRVLEVQISLSASHDVVMVLNNAGHLAADFRPLVDLRIQVLVAEGDRREQGSAAAGWRADYNYFIEQQRSYELADKALQQAITNLSAETMPAGDMPVVLGPGWPAVLLHEAVGHGLEGDFNRKGSSVYSKRLGEEVASPLCTVVDDGTLAGRPGSLNVDDEGNISQCTTLIEQGVLKNYMQDTLNARLMGTSSTGNGRRESYAASPMPRMTNTYLLPGKHTPEEVIASVDHGLYAVDFSGGQVDITAGTFVFTTSEAYLIRDGKIQHPVKGATLIGHGPSVLHDIDMLANDLALDQGTGYCGKDGQTVRVGVGQPTLRVKSMTVGGG